MEEGGCPPWISTSTVPAAPPSVVNRADNTEPAVAMNTAEREPKRRVVTIEHPPITYSHKTGLLKEEKAQYSLDSFYKKIVNSPKSFS